MRLKMRLKARLRSGGAALVCGLVLLLGLLAVAAVGPALAPHDPRESTALLFREDGTFSIPPYPPSPQFPLGSDWAGRDVLSLFLSGARYTLAIAGSLALARVLAGTLLGLWAWNRAGVLDRLVNIGGAVGGALPTLALGLAVLRMTSGAHLGHAASAALFVVFMALLEWPRVGVAMARRVQWLFSQPFVEGARAADCSQWWILRRHILPHLVDLVVVLLAVEAGAAVILLGQLGVFRAYVGGMEVMERESVKLYMPLSGEWAASLASARDSLGSAPWIPLVPAGGILWASAAFTLVAEGLRGRFRGAGVGRK